MKKFGIAAALGALISWGVIGCISALTTADLSVDAAELAKCQVVGRAAPDGGHLKAYDECKKEAGL